MDGSNNSNIDSEMLLENSEDHFKFERGETNMTFKLLSKKEKYLMISIMNTDEKVK